MASSLGWERCGGTEQRWATLLAAARLLVVSVFSFVVGSAAEPCFLAVSALAVSGPYGVFFEYVSHICAVSALRREVKGGQQIRAKTV